MIASSEQQRRSHATSTPADHADHAGGAREHAFSPYEMNGGTVLGVAGPDFVVIAADTRLSSGYNIKSRNVSRVHRLSAKTFLACGGCHADVMALYENLSHKATLYEYDHDEPMSTEAAAQLLSNTLYYKRFFPYYALSLVAGLDVDGKGYVAGYDAIGSYIRSRDGYSCNGSSASLIMPVLDNLFGKTGVSSGVASKPQLTKQQVIEICKAAFVTVGERDITCGDSVDIFALDSSGVETRESFALKKD